MCSIRVLRLAFEGLFSIAEKVSEHVRLSGGYRTIEWRFTLPGV